MLFKLLSDLYMLLKSTFLKMHILLKDMLER